MQSKFQTIDTFLVTHQSLWRFEAFLQCFDGVSLWQQQYPRLHQWLENLSIEEIEQLKNDTDELINQLSHLIPELGLIPQLISLPSTQYSLLERNLALEAGIPGRKLSQIKALGQSVLKQHHGHEWLEWCSGKGYLGRILAFNSKQPVVSFEYQQALCESGQSEAAHLDLPMTFVQGDAFESESAQVFHSDQHAVALHACGDLHVRLMHNAAAAKTKALSFSPCCYHLTHHDTYQAQSSLGQNSELRLTKQELRIPLQETVTGGERVKRHRQQEMSFRLGLNALLREELGFSEYMPVPSIKKSMLSEGFEAFCLWAAEQKGILLPKVNFAHYEKVGTQYFWQMERLSLVQQSFRRLLEIWLVLDKAMFLQEKGYHVDLSEFCNRKDTPRNILIHAVRNESR
jgi:hypothetical protein